MSKSAEELNLKGIDVADLSEWRQMVRYVPESERQFVLLRDVPKIISRSVEALQAEVQQLRATNAAQGVPEVQALYSELLYAVAQKFPDETRHQTALRYIQQRESGMFDQCSAAPEQAESKEK